MSGDNDTGKSTAVQTFKRLPISFKQLTESGYQYNPGSSCLIQNVYCLASVEGYMERSNMSYVYDEEERLLYAMGMLNWTNTCELH